MTSNKLKIIATILMILDHFADVFLPYSEPLTVFLRFIGRIAAPIFCFLIAEGYYHTSDKIKYFFRLLAFAVVSHVPFVLLFDYPIFPIEKTSVMWSLSLGLLALIILKAPKINLFFRMLLILGICFLANFGDWNFVAVLWILAFGYFRGNKLMQAICFSAVGWVFYIQPGIANIDIVFNSIHPQYATFGIFVSLLLFLLYNGNSGIKSKLFSFIFYIFYPLHLLLFYLVSSTNLVLF